MTRRPVHALLPVLLFFALAHARAAAQAAAGPLPESPRILELKRALGSGRGGALEEFWREVAREGVAKGRVELIRYGGGANDRGRRAARHRLLARLSVAGLDCAIVS